MSITNFCCTQIILSQGNKIRASSSVLNAFCVQLIFEWLSEETVDSFEWS